MKPTIAAFRHFCCISVTVAATVVVNTVSVDASSSTTNIRSSKNREDRLKSLLATATTETAITPTGEMVFNHQSTTNNATRTAYSSSSSSDGDGGENSKILTSASTIKETRKKKKKKVQEQKEINGTTKKGGGGGDIAGLSSSSTSFKSSTLVLERCHPDLGVLSCPKKGESCKQMLPPTVLVEEQEDETFHVDGSDRWYCTTQTTNEYVTGRMVGKKKQKSNNYNSEEEEDDNDEEHYYDPAQENNDVGLDDSSRPHRRLQESVKLDEYEDEQKQEIHHQHHHHYHHRLLEESVGPKYDACHKVLTISPVRTIGNVIR